MTQLEAQDINYGRAPSRSASRRKQRRWENMNLFGIHEVLAPHVIQDMMEQKDDDQYLNKYLFPVDQKDKKSAFQELLINRELLTIFRHCDEQFYCSSTAPGSRLKSIEDRCWANIEKKIRSVIVSSVLQNFKHFQFLLQIEKLLVAFVREKLPVSSTSTTTSSPSASLPASSSSRSSPPRLPAVPASSSAASSSSSSPLLSFSVETEKGGHLKVQLVESAFHRLLFHGICQFYGLKSQVSPV